MVGCRAVWVVLAVSSSLACTGEAIEPGGNNPPPVSSVTVRDQAVSPATVVIVEQVVSGYGGFLVVHEGDGAGGIGGVVGASGYLPSGTTDGLTVTLSRDAVDGETLYAMLHYDGGDQVYGFPDDAGDGPVRDANDQVIAPPFVVTVNTPAPEDPSSVTVSSQIADPSTLVVIDEVRAAADGFLVVHEANEDGDIGGVIGVSELLSAGTHVDVPVYLDQAVVDGKLLFAMLHVDGDGDGFYQFPGPDGPVIDGTGAVIAPPFIALLPDPAPSVFALDQGVAPGAPVSVLAAVADAPSFVVIHEDDGGAPGTALGASVIVTGIESNVPVPLARDIADGETLHAALYRDDGDSVFDAGDELVVVAGEPVIRPFEVTLELIASVTAADQTLERPDQVRVDRVEHGVAGFIVIHEDSGGIGGVIGASGLLAPGVHEGVVVTLDRLAVDGERLYAMLHADGDGNGQYDGPGIDPPVVDGDGVVIAPPFTVSLTTGVLVRDQAAGGANNTVAIDSVVYPGGSFIAIHEANAGGDIGGVIGVSAYLAPGANADVIVTLDRQVVDGETLFAMLHQDANGDSQYTFPGPDGPVIDDLGVMIAPPFVVSR